MLWQDRQHIQVVVLNDLPNSSSKPGACRFKDSSTPSSRLAEAEALSVISSKQTRINKAFGQIVGRLWQCGAKLVNSMR